MGYERKTEKYLMNLNVTFQVVSFDFLPWSPKSFKRRGIASNQPYMLVTMHFPESILDQL